MYVNQTDVRTGRGIIITITKRRRRVTKRPTQYGFRVTGLNHRLIANGETYANIGDLVDTLELLTGVHIFAPVIGTHHITWTVGGTYEINSRY